VLLVLALGAERKVLGSLLVSLLISLRISLLIFLLALGV